MRAASNKCLPGTDLTALSLRRDALIVFFPCFVPAQQHTKGSRTSKDDTHTQHATDIQAQHRAEDSSQDDENEDATYLYTEKTD